MRWEIGKRFAFDNIAVISNNEYFEYSSIMIEELLCDHLIQIIIEYIVRNQNKKLILDGWNRELIDGWLYNYRRLEIV